jgi:hypothetical protein
MIIGFFSIILLNYYICDMDIRAEIQSYASQPLTHQLLLSLLKEYKRPNDKLHALLKDNVLEAIKKGLYIAGPALKAGKPEPFLLANHILGPSYVSMDTVLSHYGLIPERVYGISSMTTKASRQFHTPMGIFHYTRLHLPYYAFGIQQLKLTDDQYALVASPEKALFDKVATTAGLLFRSKKDVTDYLINNLRMDEDNLKNLDFEATDGWLRAAPKRDSLRIMIKTIAAL